MTKKETVLKSVVLLESAQKVELENVEVSQCGKTEVKVSVAPDGNRMTGYIRTSRGRMILQAPLKKLDKVLAETDMAEHRERENSKQAIYSFDNMENLLETLDKAVAVS